MSELKPCPFCGSKATTRTGSDFTKSNYSVFCRNCFASTGVFLSDVEAISAWNTRTSDARIAELEAEVERLRAAPKVKPLEWDDGPNNSMASAETIFGAEYRAYLRRDGTWQLHLPPANLLGDFPSREAFKAAAQADYEAWILSAFVQP
jgi:Lar family restriction alleviation protein